MVRKIPPPVGHIGSGHASKRPVSNGPAGRLFSKRSCGDLPRLLFSAGVSRAVGTWLPPFKPWHSKASRRCRCTYRHRSRRACLRSSCCRVLIGAERFAGWRVTLPIRGWRTTATFAGSARRQKSLANRATHRSSSRRCNFGNRGQIAPAFQAAFSASERASR
jgi:hypothetical protein